MRSTGSGSRRAFLVSRSIRHLRVSNHGIVAFAIGLVVFSSRGATADYVLTVNAAKSQSSTVPGVTTQTFDSFATGKYTSLDVGIGRLTSTNFAVVAADQFGGAGGTGRYFSVGTQSGATSATLTLSNPAAYFGFWWSAGDPYNSISFLSQGRTVATFTTASAFGSLSSAYLGNPNNTSQNSGQKYAYFNLFGTNGSTIDQVVFSNANTASGFESDNWSVSSTPISGPYPGYVVVAEPGSMVLMGIGSVGILVVVWRKRSPGSRDDSVSDRELSRLG